MATKSIQDMTLAELEEAISAELAAVARSKTQLAKLNYAKNKLQTAAWRGHQGATHTRIFASYEDFLVRPDKDVNGVSAEFAAANPGWDKDDGNKGCWNCSGCISCIMCIACTYCANCGQCAQCSKCSNCAACSNCTKCTNCYECANNRCLKGGFRSSSH